MSNLFVRNINNSKPVRQKKFNSGLKLNTSHFQKLFSLASGKVKPLQDNNNLIKQILDKGKSNSNIIKKDSTMDFNCNHKVEKQTRDIGVQTDNVQLVSSSNQTEVYNNIPQYINTTEREAANALMFLFNKSDTDSTDEEFQFTDSAYEDSSDNFSNDNFSSDNLSSSQSSEELNEELSQELIKDLMRRKSGRVTAKPIHYVDEWDRFNCGKYGKYFNNDSNVSNGKQSNIVKKKLESNKLRSRKNIWIRVKQLCPGYKLQQYQYFLRKIKSKGITEDIDIKKLVQKASKKINRNNSFSQNSKTSSNKTCTTTTKRKRNNEDTNFKVKPKNKYIKKRNKNSYHLFLKSMRGEGYSKIELDNMYKYQKDKFKFKKRKQYSQSVKMPSEKMPLSEYDCVSIDDINFYQSTIEF